MMSEESKRKLLAKLRRIFEDMLRDFAIKSSTHYTIMYPTQT